MRSRPKFQKFTKSAGRGGDYKPQVAPYFRFLHFPAKGGAYYKKYFINLIFRVFQKPSNIVI